MEAVRCWNGAGNLGRNATKFANGEEPAFFFAITLHTLELAGPSAASWSKPLILYSVVPDESDDDDLHVKALNRRTQEAAANIMQNPALNGKTIVMVWEHKHIANAKLEAKYEGEAVTLRKLLKLDVLSGVPPTWPGDNYDYFWIIDYPPNSNVPSHFSMAEFSDRAERARGLEWLQDQVRLTEARVRRRTRACCEAISASARLWRPDASGDSSKKRSWN